MTYPTRDTPGHGPYGKEYGTIPDDLVRLKDLDDFEITDEEPDPRGWDVFDMGGEKVGTVEELLVSPETMTAYYAIIDCGGWFEDRRFAIPLDCVSFDHDEEEVHTSFTRRHFQDAPVYREGDPVRPSRDYWTGIGTGRVSEAAPAEVEPTETRAGEVRVPVMEETAEVRQVPQTVGFVTLRKRVKRETEHISEPVTHRRVVAEVRDVSPEEAAAAHPDTTTLREGEELRVPIVEEELRVEKTPRVTREVVLRTQEETEQAERDVELRREEIDIEEEGDVEPERTGRRDTSR